MNQIEGYAHKFGDNINTDYIIPSKYKARTTNIKDMSSYLMSEISPGFSNRIKIGDFLVAGENFGCGSSREAAPQVIKASGISAVIASSFGRIFFRNSINIGLMLIESNTESIDDGDFIIVDNDQAIINNKTKDIIIKSNVLPAFMQQIIQHDGIFNYLRYNSLDFD